MTAPRFDTNLRHLPVRFRPTILQFSIVLCLFLLPFSDLSAQVNETIGPDSTSTFVDSLFAVDDSLYTYSDSLRAYTDSLTLADTAAAVPTGFLQSRVEYDALDSNYLNVTENKIYMYNQGVVVYGDIKLEAGYIEFDLSNNLLYARGIPDSTGEMTQLPIFTQAGKTYDAAEMTYNFETSKGRIKDVVTMEGEGYLYGDKVKKVNEDILYVRDGKFTTDDRNPPDYYIQADKIKVVTDDKIITGPAYMVIADVPTPLAVPFGVFPGQSGRASGILMPTYGENNRRGFYLRGGGYYWAMNDYMDLSLTGDIYSRGGWALYANSNYRKRYAYNGNFRLSYTVIKEGDIDIPSTYSRSNEFNINWTHNQDPKARPNSRFTATVNLGSSQYFQQNTTNPGDFLTNQMTSSISYTYNNPNQPWSLTASARHNQNTKTRAFSVTLPDVSFNVQRFYPFERRSPVGGKKWYEKIGVQYRLDARNQLDTYDSLLFRPQTLNEFEYGMRHNIPIATNFKVFNHFTVSPSATYNERWYFEQIRKSYNTDSARVETDTLQQFGAARDFNVSAGITTKLYGMWQYRGGWLRAMRHVITPSVRFSYRPDFSEPNWNMYDFYIDGDGDTVTYSYYEQGIFGTAPSGRSGTVSFQVINNLDAKVMSKRDTTGELQKINLIESFQFGTSYNMAADSLKWAPFTFNGRTRILKNKVTIRIDGAFDFYDLDAEGKKVDRFMWETQRQLMRLTSVNVAFGFRFQSKKRVEGKESRFPSEMLQQQASGEFVALPPDGYVDFSIPWKFGANYKLSYRKPTTTETITQALSFNGDLSLTPNWKIGFTSGYDFKSGQLTYTTMDIYRDLHSWEMRFSWVPFGIQQSYNFHVGVKAPILQDLKVTHRKGFGDF